MRKELLPYIGALVAAMLLAICESDLLFRVQEQNLFMHTELFFKQHMIRAGGLLTWLGAYFTQYFYYPLLGAGLLCLLWAFLIGLLKSSFRLHNYWQWLTCLPIACLLITIVNLGYWVFYLKLPGHAFAATIGSIIAIGLTRLHSLVPRKYGLSTLFIVFSTAIGYPLFGFYALWGTLLMAVTGQKSQRGRFTDLSVALLSIIVVPLLCYELLFHETNIVNIYWAGLPIYRFQQQAFFAYNLPYIVLVGSTFMMALWHPKKDERWLSMVMVGACVSCVFAFWQKDTNFHRELSMSRDMERQDWAHLLSTAKATKKEPTRAMCLMKNLALLRMNRPAEEMLTYPEGACRPQAPFPVRLVHTVGKMLYLQYGLPNYCYRWCMEDGVEYGWSVEKLRLMAICSLLNGEHVAAQRYLNMLKKTDFHRKWAQEHEKYIRNPRLMRHDKELGPILPLLRRDNFLTADQSQMELFLVEHILSTQGETYAQKELARRTMYYYRNIRHKIVEP